MFLYRVRAWAWCIGSWLAVGLACAPAERSIRPGVNDDYRDGDVQKWVDRFEVESREIYREREKIMAAAGIVPDMAVADVGAGTGLFTELFAGRVGPRGTVYAVDIDPDFIKHIEERAQAHKLENIKPILSDDKDTKLPPACVEVVFVCDTYHHFEYPHAMLASIRRALRPGGMLVVVDFDRVPGRSRQWVLDHVRADKEQTIREINEAGFDLVDQPATPYLKENYVIRFRKKP